MPARQAEPRKVWQAEVTLDVHRLALGVQYVEVGKGSQKKRNLIPQDWLAPDRQTIIFDVGKHVKGWLKDQGFSLGGQLKRDALNYGVICKTLPTSGYAKVAKLSDIAPSHTWESFIKKGDYVLNSLPEPEVEAVLTKEGKSIFALFLVLGKDVEMKARIHSFARGIDHDLIQNWLTELGPIKGLGDKHNSSSNFGTFDVKEFKFLGERDLKY
ncbi:MAG: hypothetical protein M1587_04040 [Thaumarchaeota archaeon]|nr:hypothetical protein [Nitrososphaerota archaeon]